MRTAVNRDRAAVGLPAFTFSETLTAQFSTVKASHVNELRMALDQARASAGMTSLIYTDGSLSPGSSTVKAVHVMELRNNIQ